MELIREPKVILIQQVPKHLDTAIVKVTEAEFAGNEVFFRFHIVYLALKV